MEPITQTKKPDKWLHATHYSLHNLGFTLVEVLVSLSIFIVIISMAGGLYAASAVLQKRSEANRAIEQNATYLTELLGKEIRNGVVDYDAYNNSDPPLPSSILHLRARGNEGLRMSIYLDNDPTSPHQGKVVIRRETSAGSNNFNISPITDSKVVIQQFEFWIFPEAKYPDDCSAPSFTVCGGQETVTIVSKIQANPDTVFLASPVSADFQTTFAVRRYE